MNDFLPPSCELIVRAIIAQDDHILVNQGTHPQTHQYYYALPGGHVEANEHCPAALERELCEELNAKCTVGKLCFVIEQIYSGRHENDTARHELVLYFEAILQSPLPLVSKGNDEAIYSPEPGKHFRWLPLTQIAGAPFLPSVTIDYLQKYFYDQQSSLYAFQDNTTQN